MATLHYGTTLRNAKQDAIESHIGVSAVLKVFDGTMPANPATADAGTEVVSMDLPSDWMGAASSGTVGKAGTWQGTAGAAGTAQYFRIYDSGETTCHIQGDITDTSGTGAMTIDDTTISSGQTVTVATFTLTDGNGA